MKRLLIALLALALGLSAVAQQTGQQKTIYIDGVPFELTWVETGTVTVPAHKGYRTLSWDTEKKQYWIDKNRPIETPKLPKVTREVKGFWISRRLTNAQMALFNSKVAPSADVYREEDFMHGAKCGFDCVRFLASVSGLGADMPLLEDWLYAREAGALPDVEEDVPEGMLGFRWTTPQGKNDFYPIYNAADLDWPTHVITYKERDANGKLTNNMKGKWRDYRHWTASTAYDTSGGRHFCTTRFILRDLPAGFEGNNTFGVVQKNGKYGYWCYDKLAIDCVYDEIQTSPDGLLLRQGNKWGFYSFLHRKFIPAVYDSLKTVVITNANKSHWTGLEFVQDGKCGLMQLYGEVVIPACLRRTDVSMDYWLRYVGTASYNQAREKKAAELRGKQGEFEKTADFRARQADPALQEAYVKKQLEGYDREYLLGVVAQCIKDGKGSIGLHWYPYNPDEETFSFWSPLTPWGYYNLPVPVAVAPAFKEFIDKADGKALLNTSYLCVCNGTQQIASITFTLPNGKVYEYVNPDVTPDIPVYSFTELAPDSFLNPEPKPAQ